MPGPLCLTWNLTGWKTLGLDQAGAAADQAAIHVIGDDQRRLGAL